jgi:predicted nucleic acid-binding Zn ribbon protein
MDVSLVTSTATESPWTPSGRGYKAFPRSLPPAAIRSKRTKSLPMSIWQVTRSPATLPFCNLPCLALIRIVDHRADDPAALQPELELNRICFVTGVIFNGSGLFRTGYRSGRTACKLPEERRSLPPQARSWRLETHAARGEAKPLRSPSFSPCCGLPIRPLPPSRSCRD